MSSPPRATERGFTEPPTPPDTVSAILGLMREGADKEGPSTKAGAEASAVAKNLGTCILNQ